MDEVGGMLAKDVATYYLAISVGEELCQTLVSTHCQSLAVGTIEGLAGGVGDALCLGGLLGKSHGCNLWSGEHGGRDDAEVDAVLLAKDMVQGTVGLECGGVCQLAKAVDVAHGIDVGQGGLHVLVHRDALGGVGNADVVQIERREVGATSHSHEHEVAGFLLRRLLFDVFHHLAFCLGADGTDGTTCLEVDALLLQRGAQTLGNVAVEGRKNFLAVFHYRNLTAEGIEDAGKLCVDADNYVILRRTDLLTS